VVVLSGTANLQTSPAIRGTAIKRCRTDALFMAVTSTPKIGTEGSRK
jgi:hypothetical protein